MIVRIAKLCLGISVILLCAACSHLQSMYHASSHTSSKENTCINIQRQILFLNTASGNKSQWDVQSERMQLEHLYRQENCYPTMQKRSEESKSASKKDSTSS